MKKGGKLLLVLGTILVLNSSMTNLSLGQSEAVIHSLQVIQRTDMSGRPILKVKVMCPQGNNGGHLDHIFHLEITEAIFLIPSSLLLWYLNSEV